MNNDSKMNVEVAGVWLGGFDVQGPNWEDSDEIPKGNFSSLVGIEPRKTWAGKVSRKWWWGNTRCWQLSWEIYMRRTDKEY